MLAVTVLQNINRRAMEDTSTDLSILINQTALENASAMPNHAATNGRSPRIVERTAAFIAWAVVTYLILYTATLGNLLTIIAIVRARWWKTGIQVLIFSLTVSDFLSSFIVYPQLITNNLVGPSRFPYTNGTFCRLAGYVSVCTAYITPLHCCMIAVNRLCAIVFPRHSKNFTDRAAGCVMACLAWLIPGIIFSVSLAEFDGRFGLTPPFLTCGWLGRSASRAFSFSAGSICLYAPTVIIAVCYSVIFLRLRVVGATLRVRPLPDEISAEVRRQSLDPRRLVRRWQVAKMMLTTFMVFVVCYIPLTSFFYLAGDYYAPPMPLVMACLFTVSYLGPFFNPIIYAVMNRDFHNAYAAILRRIICCARSTPRTAVQLDRDTALQTALGQQSHQQTAPF
ncbi:hypothetical protein BV898_18930 [Hypsibius exemplaris]|uniref:G-protein coupled receptors family 1 profile domain-containing protein n=1 Tax=Hypsibius exemplaris TaxID=2072580 RepID=A0A9X6RNY7_HYPEX|nr:hypothetical protein BV898_18930 [Hypsibius exemplaris]